MFAMPGMETGRVPEMGMSPRIAFAAAISEVAVVLKVAA
jgi:hypothetical protein